MADVVDMTEPQGPSTASAPHIDVRGKASPLPKGQPKLQRRQKTGEGVDVDDMGGGAAHQPLVHRGLPLAVKQRIVVLFAQFQGLAAIGDAIKAEFGLDLDHRTILHYDAGKPKARIGRRLRQLYAEARKAWIVATADVGIAHQSQRLRLIERLIEKAERARDFAAAKGLLELAAKEMGGVLTNVSKVEHRGAVVHMSMEDARAELAARLSGAIDGGVLAPKLLEANDKSDDG